MWFRDYKTPDGKPVNKFGYDDQWQNKEFTLKVRRISMVALDCHALEDAPYLRGYWFNGTILQCGGPF